MKNYHGFFSLPLGLTILIKVLNKTNNLTQTHPVKIAKILYRDELPLVKKKVRTSEVGLGGVPIFLTVLGLILYIYDQLTPCFARNIS